MAILGQNVENSPFETEQLDGITNPNEYRAALQDQMHRNLQTGGFVPPTEGITKPVSGNNALGFFDDLMNKVVSYSGVGSLDGKEGDYARKRFDFITAEEKYSQQAYDDYLGRKRIGYGFRLDDANNIALAKTVLNVDDKGIEKIKSGEKVISDREARALYEASVGDADRMITEKLGDAPLRANQRLALTSLIYNNHGLLGKNLVKSIKDGNIEGALDEIRNKSNRYKNKAIASRRGREADMFSNFDDAPDTNLLSNMFGKAGDMAEEAFGNFGSIFDFDFNKKAPQQEEDPMMVDPEYIDVRPVKPIRVGDKPDMKAVGAIATAKNPADVAAKYLGLSESSEEGAAAVRGFFKNAVGDWNPNKENDKDFAKNKAWCAAFLSQVLRDSGVDMSSLGGDKFAQVRSQAYLGAGQAVQPKGVKPGDIMVKVHTNKERKEQKLGVAHVGIVAKVEGDEVYFIGGNTGDHVELASYNMTEKDVRFRRINGMSDIPPKTMPSMLEMKLGKYARKAKQKFMSLFED